MAEQKDQTIQDHHNAITRQLNGVINDQQTLDSAQAVVDHHLKQIVIKSHRLGFDACSDKILKLLETPGE